MKGREREMYIDEKKERKRVCNREL